MTDHFDTPPLEPTAPRIRWAGIVWGALFTAFGITVMVELSTVANRRAFLAWFDGLGSGGAALVTLIALGVFVLVLGILGAVGRAQNRPRATRRTDDDITPLQR